MIFGDRGGLLGTVEKAAAKFRPGLSAALRLVGESIGHLSRIGRFDSRDPVEGYFLPVGKVPEFLVDAMRNAVNHAPRQIFG